jgi:hypothetical protein
MEFRDKFRDELCGLATLALEVLDAQKKTANSRHWADHPDEVYIRNLIASRRLEAELRAVARALLEVFKDPITSLQRTDEQTLGTQDASDASHDSAPEATKE